RVGAPLIAIKPILKMFSYLSGPTGSSFGFHPAFTTTRKTTQNTPNRRYGFSHLPWIVFGGLWQTVGGFSSSS
ncbi:MAG: hypothetical protein AAF922_06460, partial [Pseudomonadota bacterium]